MTAPATLDRINDFPGLVRYLRDELEWEIPEDAAFDDLTFNWTPSEIGLDLDEPIEITQLRPLRADQRWGVFFLNFPHGKLPVTLMRRILRGLSKRKRASANAADRAAWEKDDLIFISAVGDADDRRLSFAHFQERGNDLPTLRVIGWDKDDTVRRLSHTNQVLRSKLGWLYGEGLQLNWRDAFTERPRESVRTAKEMAEALAVLARDIRDRIKMILPKEKANGDLKQLFEAVKQTLSRDLDTEKFADTYAQTIAYGLLSARINQVRERDEKHEAAQKTGRGPKPALPAITAEAAGQAMPTTNPFLKELFGSFLSAGGRDANGTGLDFDELGIGEVVDLLNAADIEAVLLDFDKHKSGDDPVIHFYEGFLHAYDRALKVQRGVFYTPRPVVSFIVRSVDEVLRTEFGLADGLADTTTWSQFVAAHPDAKLPVGVKGDEPFVKILDPATGTGTFLVEVIDLIHATMTEKWKSAGLDDNARIEAWNAYVPNHLLPRLYGFELMMAPYAVAHMKLGLKLADTGYRFEGVDANGTPARARVFLTNALEPARDLGMELSFMSEALAHEAKAANQAKEKARFTTVIGNPPYSKMSGNLSSDARALADRFRSIDGVKVVERGALALEMALQDDYIKFWSKALGLIDQVGIGCVCFITNSRYLNAPTLRAVRSNLLKEFGLRRFTDLGGQVSERANDARSDENVFDIEQGVAVGLFAKGAQKRSHVAYSRIWGDRDAKSLALSRPMNVELIHPVAPMFLFSQNSDPNTLDYDGWWKLDECMPFNSGAVITSRDALLISFDREEALNKVMQFSESPVGSTDIMKIIGFSAKSKWDLEVAKSSVRTALAENSASARVKPIRYRPYDDRFVYYDTKLLDTPSKPVFDAVSRTNNLVLLTPRVKNSPDFSHIAVSTVIAEKKAASHDRATQMFPALTISSLSEGPTPNYSADFMRAAADVDAVDPRQLAAYVALILHSPTYRRRYGKAAMQDYPRIPLPLTAALFAELVPLGTELVALHLLDPADAPILADPAVRFVNPNGAEARLDGRKADARRNAAGRVYVNDACWFETVPVSVWEHWIGGYQPAQKWLKDRAAKGGKNKREGRVLTAEDQLHYRRMITALGRTAELMVEIDAVIDRHGGWPDAFRGMAD